MEELQLEHTYGQRRLFTDSSKVILKTVLLHSGDTRIFSPFLLAYAVRMIETLGNL